MTETVYLQFKNASDIYPSAGRTFYFLGSNVTAGDGGFFFSRSINKNIITSNLPVNSYYGGGLAIDIGMTEDTFDIQFSTYNYHDYRYLCGLVKCNNDLKIGDLHIVVDSQDDSFSVGLKNAQFNMKAGAGFLCEVKLTLIVVDPDLSSDSAENLVL